MADIDTVDHQHLISQTPHTRHASRRLALSSAPTAAGFKPYARRQALFPAPIKIHQNVMSSTDTGFGNNVSVLPVTLYQSTHS